MGAAFPIRVVDHFTDKMWRLHNLYWIVDETGKKVRFRPNWTQENLLSELHYLNLIIKARQLGITSIVDIYILDDAVFNSNMSGAINADNERKATGIFREKSAFPTITCRKGCAGPATSKPIRRTSSCSITARLSP